MDVAAWARENGYPVKLLHPPVIDEVKACINDDPVAQQEFVKHRAALDRAQTLVTIERATIRDAVGFVELPDGQICYEGNWWLPYLQDHPAYKRRFPPKRRRLTGDVYSLLCLWGSEFYHWFHDVLPRLETALLQLPPDTKFIINSNPKNWQLDSLDAYGIGLDRLEPQPEGTHTSVERLWFATPVGHTSLGSGVVIRRVANRLRHHFVSADSEEKLHRLYVSRRRAAFRRMVNENEVTPFLQNEGFDTIVCEDFSLAEQVALFAKATVIVGVHGGGLINLIYCLPGSRVGEIYSGRVFPHYLVTARQLGMQFSRFEADPVPIGDSQIDIQVNPTAFNKWIFSLITKVSSKWHDK